MMLPQQWPEPSSLAPQRCCYQLPHPQWRGMVGGRGNPMLCRRRAHPGWSAPASSFLPQTDQLHFCLHYTVDFLRSLPVFLTPFLLSSFPSFPFFSTLFSPFLFYSTLVLSLFFNEKDPPFLKKRLKHQIQFNTPSVLQVKKLRPIKHEIPQLVRRNAEFRCS